MKGLSGKKGFVLGMTAVVILGLAAITAAFIYIVSAQSRIAALRIENSRAFWIAEAGIHDVVARIKKGTIGTTFPTTITGTLAGGSYSVAVTKDAVNDIYTMVSTGTMGYKSRILQQKATVSNWGKAFTDYGAFGGSSSNFTMDHTSIINGNLCTNGWVVCNSTIAGKVYAAGGVTGSGSYTTMPRPDPYPQAPALDTSYYTGQIATAASQTAGDRTFTNYNLTANTYVNGSVTINGSVTNATGSKLMIVCTGNMNMSNNANVGSDIKLISGATLDIGKDAVVNPRGTLYSTTGFTMKQSGVIIDQTSLVTPGNVDIWQSITIRGALFCGGNLVMKQGASVTGGTVVLGNVTMTQTSSLTSSPGNLPQDKPDGLSGGVSITLSDWTG